MTDSQVHGVARRGKIRLQQAFDRLVVLAEGHVRSQDRGRGRRIPRHGLLDPGTLIRKGPGKVGKVPFRGRLNGLHNGGAIPHDIGGDVSQFGGRQGVIRIHAPEILINPMQREDGMDAKPYHQQAQHQLSPARAGKRKGKGYGVAPAPGAI